MKIEKKDLILEYLSDIKTASTSNIANKIKADVYRCRTLLEDLLKEKKVRRIQFGTMIFWELK